MSIKSGEFRERIPKDYHLRALYLTMRWGGLRHEEIWRLHAFEVVGHS